MLSEDDHQRIAKAIAQAEEKSAGEIFCVFAQDVSRYREVPLAWAALAALVVPAVLLLALWRLGPLAQGGLFSAWSDGSVHGAQSLIVTALSSYTLAQAAIFVVVALVVGLLKVRRIMTPRFLKRHRVRQVARHHFAAAGARLHHWEPHILIYASLGDRQVELVAHKAIHEAVGEEPWNRAVAAVVAGMKNGSAADGFVRAIEICGEQLAKHFPPDGPAKNRLPNDIVET